MGQDTTNGDIPRKPGVTGTPSQHAVSLDSPLSADAIEAWLLAHLAASLGLDTAAIDTSEPFDSYGLSSKDLLLLAGDLEQWLGTTLPPTIAYQHSTVAALARHIAGVAAQVPGPEASAAPGHSEPIAVIGMSCRFPGATNPRVFWKLLHDGVDAIGEVSAARHASRTLADPGDAGPSQPGARWGGFLEQADQFDPHFFGIAPREAMRMDPQQRILLEVAWEAIEDAGQSATRLAGTPTGVFVGVATHDYSQIQLDDSGGMDIYAATGSALSIAANRLSYLLDLRGPSLAVDTACSSSLVAVHLACQSLCSGESNLALAGGVNIILSSDWTLSFARSGMLAPDGRCKTFDASADGFVRGEGCGVVVLKRLSDARRDGDRILALIRGSAVNQDGRSNGLVAPNSSAQEAVIRQALGSAGVAPAQISYVEAHGTGTALGDPIELGALQAVLMQDRAPDQPCAVGSVKTNIGHLEAAAGIAGLIKVVLALGHHEIPPHLHFKTLNPHISLQGTSFTIPTQSQPWESHGAGRLAGVSSFGFGGTNAHVIVEEAPASEPSGPSRPWHLLTFSAKTASALNAMAADLVAELRARPEQDLADLAYTHQVGRKAFGHRRMLVCRDRDEAVEALERGDPRRVSTTGPESHNRTLVFMFPGQGAQRMFMGQGLYESEAVFRQQVDRCAALLRSHLELDLRDILYPGEDATETAAQLLDQTWITQPALFVVEYALAQLWMAWGVRPQALIGHSIGEYVAACLAGVFSLEDALTLIAARARLMHQLPAGAMLAVPLPEPDVRALMGTQLSLATVNGPARCVVAGPTPAIDELQRRLDESGHECRRLRVSHAFHSRMMEPIHAPFAELVKTIALHPPCIPYISNVTGTWITAADATEPAYWATHLCQTVRFADGLEALAHSPKLTLLEVGPGQALSSLARQYTKSQSAARWSVLPSLPHARGQQPDLPGMLEALGKLWLAGHAVDWPAFYIGQVRRKLSLPPHPFERQRYWIEASQAPTSTKETAMSHPQQETHDKSTRLDTILSTIREIVARLLQTEPARVEVYAPFLEMGADSLVLVQAIRTIEKTFGVAITVRQLFEELTTIGEVAGYIDQQLSPDQPLEHLVEPEAASAAHAAPQQPAAAPTIGAVPSVQPSSPIHTDGADAGLEQVMAQQLDVLAQVTQVLAQQLTVLGGQAPAPQTPLEPAAQMATPSKVPLSNGNGHGYHSHNHSTTNGAEVSAVVPSHKPGWRPTAPDMAHKKPFVPYQPINVEARFDPLSGLDARQQRYLAGFIERYTHRTKTSRQLTQCYRPVLADNRASAGFRFSIKEMLYPIVSERSQGALIWDVDGNQYLDLSMGFGVNLFGHNPPFVQQALEAQLQRGVQLGPQSNLAGEVAELICELTGVERVTFCNSGTEAVMTAIRLARAVTGRNKIALFAGSFHGAGDGTLVVADRLNGSLAAAAMAPGVMPGVAEQTLVLEYGAASSLDVIRAHAHELAAVLVEPVQSRHPDLQPGDFLRQLRLLTHETGVALIFDEMITGFRIHRGGAQAHFGVQADIVTYGKIVGGGMPLGVVAGKAAYMDAIDGGMWQYGDISYPRATTTFFAGTFCKHPLAMTAARAVLGHLKAQGPALQEQLNQRTAGLVERLNRLFDAEGVPIKTVWFGSLFRFTFTSNMDLFFYHLVEKGLYIWEGRNMFLATAHTDDDLDQIVAVAGASIRELREGGFLPEQPLDGGRETGAREGGAPALNAITADQEAAQQPRAASVAMNGAQRLLWMLAQLSENALAAYNESLAIGLHGPLDLAVLRSALQQVVDRHEALRTTLNDTGDTLHIAASSIVELPLVDCSDSAEGTGQAQALDWLAAEHQRHFDLAGGRLFRAAIVKLADQHHILLLTAHHIITDGLSMQLLVKELSACYSAALRGAVVGLEPPVQFQTFLERQAQQEQSDAMAAHEAYWLEQFAGTIPVSDLLTARSRPLVMSYRGACHSLSIEAALCEELKALSRVQRSTLFMTLLAAYMALLHRLSDRDDLIVGVPVSLREEHEQQNLIGYTINLVPVRSMLRGNPTFREHLAALKRTLFDAFEHGEYPFARLLDRLSPPRDAGRPPLINLTFNLDRVEGLPAMAGLEVELVTLPVRTTKFDISLNALEIQNTIRLDLNYNSDLFDDAAIRRMLEQFRTLLGGIVSNPDQRLAYLPLLGADERQQLLVEWNSTTVAHRGDTCVHQLFEEQAASDPDAVAVVFGEERLSYQDLNRRANQLAHTLRTYGVGPEVLVCLYLERSPELIVGMLGVLKAGGAFVPLDPTLPPERLSFILHDTQAPVLLTQEQLLAALPASAAVPLCLDRDRAVLDQASAEEPVSSTIATNLAYVIYTSGSTGVPKGVAVSHANLANLVAWHQRAFAITSADRASQLAGLGFDAVVWELWPYLLAGARVCLPDEQTHADLRRLLAWLDEQGITVSFLPTPLAEAALSLDWAGSRQLELLLTGGDVLHRGPQAGRGFELVNNYGPTENTVVATWTTVEAEVVGSPPIGCPVDNVQAYVLDQHLQPVPIGMPGELYLGGASLARGYLNRPELTAERFVPNPFVKDEGERMKDEEGRLILHPSSFILYKTGDLVRYRADGQLEYLGRIDAQIKIRGFRVEPGEIEAALARHPAVQDVIVVARDDLPGAKRLVAYIVASSDSRSLDADQESGLMTREVGDSYIPDSTHYQTDDRQPPTDNRQLAAELRVFLKEQLPSYMVPTAFCLVDSLPLTPNGKVDRRALPVPDAYVGDGNDAFVAPRTPAELALADIWRQVLGREHVGIYNDFFELGGDSILSFQIVARASRAGLRFTPKQLFQYPTIARLAAVMDVAAPVHAEQGLVQGVVPLTPIQSWFFEQNQPEPHHFNQALLLTVTPSIPAHVLEQALPILVEHHDALRLRYTCADGIWVQRHSDSLEQLASFRQVDLSGIPESELAMALETNAAELQSSLNLAAGPLMCAALFQRGPHQPARLLLVIHHLVVDAVSWRVLIEDLHEICRQLSDGRSVDLPPKTTSFKDWAERLTVYARSEALGAELDFWLNQPWEAAPRLPRDYPARGAAIAANTVASMAEVVVALDQEATQALLYEVPEVYHTQINEVLLAALAQTFARWTGSSTLLLDLEGHGREQLFEDVDLSRTAGWFTTLFPVLLAATTEHPGELLNSVKEQLRRIPNHGIGYSLLRYLRADGGAAQLRALPQAEVSFNYLGQLDRTLDREALFALASEPHGPTVSPAASRMYLLEITARIIGGKLELSWLYSRASHRPETIAQLAQSLLDVLRGLIVHCQAPEAGGYTPSDFPLAQSDQAELDQALNLFDFG
jgi:amino acid adenylation domain-containing protein/non-ribosomal peptide synthase protein (TIGR01720 family)